MVHARRRNEQTSFFQLVSRLRQIIKVPIILERSVFKSELNWIWVASTLRGDHAVIGSWFGCSRPSYVHAVETPSQRRFLPVGPVCPSAHYALVEDYLLSFPPGQYRKPHQDPQAC